MKRKRWSDLVLPTDVWLHVILPMCWSNEQHQLALTCKAFRKHLDQLLRFGKLIHFYPKLGYMEWSHRALQVPRCELIAGTILRCPHIFEISSVMPLVLDPTLRPSKFLSVKGTMLPCDSLERIIFVTRDHGEFVIRREPWMERSGGWSDWKVVFEPAMAILNKK